MTWSKRLGVMTAAIVIAAVVPQDSSAQSSPAAAILAALKDSILNGGELTRVVRPPVRSYQHPPQSDALPALGALLGLPVSRGKHKPVSCRWAPVASIRLGMDITVTEFDVIGDSAKVSILRQCQQRQRGRTTSFQSEPTWFLRRQDGRWVVVRTWMRVTASPAGRVQAVG